MNGNTDEKHDPAQTAIGVSIVIIITACIAIGSGWRWRGEPQPLALEPLGVHALITLASLLIARWHRSIQLETPDNDGGPGPITVFVIIAFVTGTAFINLFLAGAAAISGNADKYWICVLALPGAAAVFALNGKPNPADEANTNENEAAKHAAELARASGLRVIQGYVLNGLIQAISAIAGILLLVVGIGYFTIIRLALLEDKFAGWSVLWKVFPVIGEKVGPEIAAIAIVLPVVMGAIGVGAAAWGAYVRRRHQNYDRNLSDEEHALIEAAYGKLSDFLEENRAPRLVHVVYWGGITVAIGSMAVLAFFIGENGLGSFIFESMRAPAEGWYIYNDVIGVSDIFGIFLFIIAIWLPLMALAVYWPAFGIYNYTLSKSQSAKGEVLSTTLWKAIAADVRKGNITDAASFNPEDYILQANKMMLKVFTNITLAMAAIYAILWLLDRMDYQLVTKDGITYRQYFSLETTDASYSDIEYIDVACREASDEQLILRYQFEMTSGATINIAWFSTPRKIRELLPSRLEAWRQADALARTAGAEVVHDVFRGEEEFDRDYCQTELSALLGEDIHDQVMPLLEK